MSFFVYVTAREKLKLTDTPYVYVDTIAKPIDNLALRVFQRYYHELCQALSSCPEEVAAVLYSHELVTMQERSQAVDTSGLTVTPFRKAEILVQAVEKE